MKILTIAGSSGSGKTTLAQLIKGILPGDSTELIVLDNYYHNQENVLFKEREKVNYDHPDALELELLNAHLKNLLAGNLVQVPIYDFSKHTRTNETTLVKPCELLILEGILTLYNEKIRALTSLSVFVDTPIIVCYERRLIRDIEERGRTLESVKAQWQQTVLPMYEKYCLPTKAYADMSIDGTEINLNIVSKILDKLAIKTKVFV